jgi:hypothetical protein
MRRCILLRRPESKNKRIRFSSRSRRPSWACQTGFLLIWPRDRDCKRQIIPYLRTRSPSCRISSQVTSPTPSSRPARKTRSRGERVKSLQARATICNSRLYFRSVYFEDCKCEKHSAAKCTHEHMRWTFNEALKRHMAIKGFVPLPPLPR